MSAPPLAVHKAIGATSPPASASARSRAAARGQTLPQMLVAHAQSRPGDLAQRVKRKGIWRCHTWADLAEKVRMLALGAATLGLSRGDTVVVVGENEPEHYWALFAAQSLGMKTVSVYPDATAEELQYLCDDSQARMIFAQDQEQVDKALHIAPGLTDLRGVAYWDDSGMWSYRHDLLHSFDSLMAAGRREHQRDPRRFYEQVASGQIDDLALLTYTSGTTSKPKGVMISHRWLVDNATRMRSALQLEAGMEYLSYTPLAWITEQLLGVTLGLTVPLVVNFPEGPDQVLPNLRELSPHIVLFGPRQWESIAATIEARMLHASRVPRAIYRWSVAVGHAVRVARLEGRAAPLGARVLLPLAEAMCLHAVRDQFGFLRSRVAVSGGTAMAPDVFRLFHALGVPLRNIYGCSEFGLVAGHRGTRYDLETVGPLLDVDPAYGEQLQARIESSGELLLRGGTGFLGYWRKPDKTAALDRDGWFASGDAVQRTSSGELVFLDRIEHLVKLANGHSYPPQFIETRLRFSPFIKDVMVLGDASRPWVGALINIDMAVASRWAEERRIAFSTFTDLSQRPEILGLVRDEIRRINTLLPPASRVVRFANFPKELDADEGELTRTRKLRREFLEHRYRPLIEGLYAGAAEIDCSIPVTYQDGRQGVLRARVAVTDIESGPSR
ncbi:AMP-dependent synthetase/ligase [Hydrogenophaga intermedia]|uniref:AMP-dependent synthetase/ligase n=1 Tax=Hydrogenophaga intermedia TaxID=65786 RepID=UPI0020443A94|nr:AMP-binding protein [Hydrogenophaga intermedia]MCM3562757.1 AMP-binding protein [Hydrogenophaga intermedia]